MLLYHGTNDIIGIIDLSKCKLRTDFGKGFYFSDKIGTAQNWAKDRTTARGKGIPTILQYEIDMKLLNQLNGLRFSLEPTVEWLDFVGLNRKFNKGINEYEKEPRHDYDWVSGPIADDKMNIVVDEYFADEISIDEAIKRAKVLPKTYQFSLHTEKAVKCLNEINVFYRQFKNNYWLPTWIKRT